jgi:outer membrane lipoprotein-sorting protein
MRKIHLFTIPLFTCLLANAQVINPADRQIVEKIMQGNAHYTSFKGEFKQIRRLDYMDEDIVSEGTFYYRKPGQMVLRFSDPEGDVMLVDGDRLTLASAGGKRTVSAQSDPKIRGIKTVLTSAMQGNALEMGAREITCRETPGQYVVTAKLDAESQLFETVVACYDRKDLSLVALTTKESEDNYTTYELSGKVFNQPIEDAVFKIK